MKDIIIGNKKIGGSHGLYFVADIAANHDGSLERAFKLIELAQAAGADAAKFQNFQAPKIVSRQGFEALGDKMSHQAGWKKSVYETYQDASLPAFWTAKLKAKCDEVGLEYFTSPYDFESVDLVDPFVNVYKIGSGDITWPEIIKYIAKKGKPIMLATGASDMNDVARAMNILRVHGTEVILMQCNTNYTARPENFNFINLNVLKSWRDEFPEVVLGLSDHTPGHATVLGAVALGARVFEKHFTDDNNREGPDHKFAMNPQSWREMVDRANELFRALGDGIKKVEKNEEESIGLQRRSIRAGQDLPAGHLLERDDLSLLRPIPQNGLPPYRLTEVIGKKLIRPLKEGDCVLFNNLQI
jgi:N-acetylneuraminate synthase